MFVKLFTIALCMVNLIQVYSEYSSTATVLAVVNLCTKIVYSFVTYWRVGCCELPDVFLFERHIHIM